MANSRDHPQEKKASEAAGRDVVVIQSVQVCPLHYKYNIAVVRQTSRVMSRRVSRATRQAEPHVL